MRFINENEALEQFDEMLNATNELVNIGAVSFEPSEVLKNCDPTAYRCYFSNWLDSENLTIEESECKHPNYSSNLDCDICEDCGLIVQMTEE